MVSYNIKRVVTGNGTWTNKTRNAMFCDHIWSGQLVTSVWFSTWQQKNISINYSWRICALRQHSAKKECVLQVSMLRQDGSLGLPVAAWDYVSEVCTVSVWVWDHSAWVIPNNWHISCTASTILCVKWEEEKNTHLSFCVASDYLDCQKIAHAVNSIPVYSQPFHVQNVGGLGGDRMWRKKRVACLVSPPFTGYSR